jgi:hypothetical protein
MDEQQQFGGGRLADPLPVGSAGIAHVDATREVTSRSRADCGPSQ